jgi:serine/threonine protein kinase
VHQSDGRPWVKLLDFGLARRSSQDVSRIAGTPDYISPEHARGKPAGPPADLYAFGVMAFHLLTGRLPFLGNTPMEVMEQHVHKPPPVPAEIDSSIPPAMSALILRLLDKDPSNRPDAKTVKADLRAAAKQLRLAQTQVGPMPQPPGGTVVRTDPSRPQTSEQNALKPDPRLERIAIATDKLNQAPPAAALRPTAFARNWPWFAGGLALLWLLGVAIYVLLTPPPPVHTDAIPIPAPKEEPAVAAEPENENTLEAPDEPAKPEKAPAPRKK